MDWPGMQEIYPAFWLGWLAQLAGKGTTKVNRVGDVFSDLTASQIAARKRAAYAVYFQHDMREVWSA